MEMLFLMRLHYIYTTYHESFEDYVSSARSKQ